MGVCARQLEERVQVVVPYLKPVEPVWIMWRTKRTTLGCWLEIVIGQKTAVVVLLEPVVEMNLIQV